MTPPDATARLGVIGPAHGTHGEVLVHPDADLVDALAAGLVCRRADGDPLEVVGVREHKQRVVVRFAGVDDRDAAEALRGTVLEVDRHEVTDDDAVWVDALLGAEVADDGGDLVGLVEGVEDGPAHDWLVVARPDGGHARVPLVEQLVEVDTTAGTVTVRAVPGLLDDGWV